VKLGIRKRDESRSNLDGGGESALQFLPLRARVGAGHVEQQACFDLKNVQVIQDVVTVGGN
jgi:hypothetical protein